MRYSEFQYGNTPGVYLYGDAELPTKPDETDVDGYVDLEKYVPPFIRNMDEFHEWYQTQGHEVGREWKLIRMIKRQLFPVTIDTEWGCVLWETMLGIKPADTDTIQNRVGAIIAKRGAARTCTVNVIKQTVESITGVECKVIEYPEQYRFTIRYTGAYGVVRNTRAVERLINEIKPAHLAFNIEFRYVIWDEVKEHTWDEVAEATWGGLRVFQKTTNTDQTGENDADNNELSFKEAGGQRRCGHRRFEL